MQPDAPNPTEPITPPAPPPGDTIPFTQLAGRGQRKLGGVAVQEERVVLAGAPVGKVIDIRGEAVTSLTWASYMLWRRTKCRPFDYEGGPALATSAQASWDGPGRRDHVINRDRAIDEIDQAVHEFVGECGELSALILEAGPLVFMGTLRDKLIDECGDCLFCGAWVLDAWGRPDPLRESDDLELLRITDADYLGLYAAALAQSEAGAVLSNPKFCLALGQTVTGFLNTLLTHASLLCNSFKKLKFQRKPQDVDVQVSRVIQALFVVNQFLIVANSSVEEAMQYNMRKLDARYPGGYQAGQGAGDRSGAGAGPK